MWTLRKSGEKTANANVIFQVGGLQVFGNGHSIQLKRNYIKIEMCAEFLFLQSQSTFGLARHRGFLATQGGTL